MKLMTMTTVKLSMDTLKTLKNDYLRDHEFENIHQEPKDPNVKRSKRLFFENRLCLPKGTIRAMIMHDNHESLLGGHRGLNKTLSLLKRSYYWYTMNVDVKRYIATCHRFQEAKSITQRKSGQIQPFPPPTRKWEVISMDFIFNLPKSSENKDGILVVVDKLSKRTHFIAFEGDLNAKEVALIFCNEIFKHHELPRKIISDRDSRFTGTFCKELLKIIRVKLNLSTAYHPETDGQSQRAFRTIEEMLRCYTSYTEKNCSRFLPGLEFAYNNHARDSTLQTPFFIEYGQHPFSISDILLSDGATNNSSNLEAGIFLQEIEIATEAARHGIEQANLRYADQVNEHRTTTTYEIDDFVLLSTKYLPLKSGRVRKLTAKYIGPFRIIKILGNGSAYELELRSSFKNLHPAFHISLLRKYEPDELRTYELTPSAYHIETTEFKIESIRANRICQNSLQYLVHSKDTSPAEDTWLDSGNIQDPYILIDYANRDPHAMEYI